MFSDLAQILAYSQQVPNIAPNERFLPNADYGRVGALKLANNLFKGKSLAYAKNAPSANNAVGEEPWIELGKYHFYLLSRDLEIIGNEGARAALETQPLVGTFKFGKYDPAKESIGPFKQTQVLREIAEAARVYGFPTAILTGAVLTLIKSHLRKADVRISVAEAIRDGYDVASYTPGALEGLWGVNALSYPSTFRWDAASMVAKGDRDVGKRNGKRKKNGKRRKRSRYY